jgi:hypothetical protein
MTLTDHHYQREDRAERWRRIAAGLESHPEWLTIALDNLARWERWGRVHPGPILEWRRLIQAAQHEPSRFAQLLDFLRAENHDQEPLKSCSPFVGLPNEPTLPT